MSRNKKDRRIPRVKPNARGHYILAGTHSYPCRILDLSVWGAALRSDFSPAIGTPIRLGRSHGWVVRHFEGGFAIEFAAAAADGTLNERRID
jgi:hypothetical protein